MRARGTRELTLQTTQSWKTRGSELCPGELPHLEVRQGKTKNQKLKRRAGEVKGLQCHGVQGESCLEAERDQLKVK